MSRHPLSLRKSTMDSSPVGTGALTVDRGVPFSSSCRRIVVELWFTLTVGRAQAKSFRAPKESSTVTDGGSGKTVRSLCTIDH